ncbi:uncharacterized protein PFLUO_LOCUS2148 [Penicillium psychrofluorescens]|uniref:uncharacterized protein n=1 Tax=Penicillium psychrofluorescens TaxID=3158075 RepID=UPI003CCE25C4
MAWNRTPRTNRGITVQPRKRDRPPLDSIPTIDVASQATSPLLAAGLMSGRDNLPDSPTPRDEIYKRIRIRFCSTDTSSLKLGRRRQKFQDNNHLLALFAASEEVEEQIIKMTSHYHDNAYDTTYDYGATGYGTTYDTGYGATAYDPSTGAYDQHLDYRTDGSQRHHRERVDPSGTYRHRDVDRRDDGTSRVHREYDNPNTGTSYHRDYET